MDANVKREALVFDFMSGRERIAFLVCYDILLSVLALHYVIVVLR